MASKNVAEQVIKFSLRGGARYLQDNGIDIGEQRLRTLMRQHEIFINDPDTDKAKVGDSELEIWEVSKPALDKYIAAVKSGGVRTTSGAKVYKVSATADQLALLRDFCAKNGMAEPTRANTAYKPKEKSSSNGEGNLEQSMASLATQDDADAPEGLFEEQPAEATA